MRILRPQARTREEIMHFHADGALPPPPPPSLLLCIHSRVPCFSWAGPGKGRGCVRWDCGCATQPRIVLRRAQQWWPWA